MNETFAPPLFDPKSLKDIRLKIRQCYLKRALNQPSDLVKKGFFSFFPSAEEMLPNRLQALNDPIELAKNRLYWRNQAIAWAFLPIVAAGGLYFLSHFLSGFPAANPTFDFGSKLPESLAKYLREHELLNRKEVLENRAQELIDKLQQVKPKKQKEKDENVKAGNLNKRASMAEIVSEISRLPIRLLIAASWHPYTFLTALGLGSLSGLLFTPIVDTLNKSRIENWLQAEQREYVRDLTKTIQTTELMAHKLYGKAWKQLSYAEKKRVREQLELLGYDPEHVKALINRLERGYHEVKTSALGKEAFRYIKSAKTEGTNSSTISEKDVNLSVSQLLSLLWAVAILSFTFPILSEIYRHYSMRPFYVTYQPKAEHKYQAILQQIAEYEGMRQLYKPTKLNVYLHGLETALNKEIQADLEKLLRNQKAALPEGVTADIEQKEDKE